MLSLRVYLYPRSSNGSDTRDIKRWSDQRGPVMSASVGVEKGDGSPLVPCGLLCACRTSTQPRGAAGGVLRSVPWTYDWLRMKLVTHTSHSLATRLSALATCHLI